MKRFILLIASIFLSIHIWGQYYSIGDEPFQTKWKQISNARYKIIFPQDAELAALKFANLLCVVDSNSTGDYLFKNRKINVVIHNHSVLSNGFVAIAPKRMEIITHSPASINSQPWLKQLAIHETRHYAQISNLYSGLFKPLYCMFGEQAIGLAAGLIPMWYLEGDAVAYETATSNSGRGRQADFYNYYRAHYLTEDKPFKYDKWLLGSYKDNIPDHYSLGYQLVVYGKLKYGNNIWSQTLKYSTQYPFSLFPFYLGLKSKTGLSRKALHKETFNYLDSLWSINQNKNKTIGIKNYKNPINEYADYISPFPINDSLIVAYKTTLSKAPSFVSINLNTGKEKILFNPGYLTGNPSYYENKIYWSEYSPHPRWEMLNFSVLKSFDLITGDISILSDRGKYFSPVYNPMENSLYAISRLDSGENMVVVYDNKYNLKNSIQIPNLYDPFELFISNRGRIFIAAVTDKGKVIIEYINNSFNLVFGPTYLDINSFSSVDDLIFFTQSLNYVEDSYCYNILYNKTYRVVTSSFGSKYVKYIRNNKNVIYSEFSSSGYGISIANFDTLNTTIHLPDRIDDPFTSFLDKIQPLNIDSISPPKKDFQISDYKGVKSLINIHSWAPFFIKQNYFDANEAIIKPGITLLSQNLTGSSILTFSYGYDFDHNIQIGYLYSGFWPKFSISYETYSKRKSDTCRISNIVGSIMIPYRVSQGHFSTFFAPVLSITNTNDLFATLKNTNKNIQYFEQRFLFATTERMAKKDLRPRNGFIADITYSATPFENQDLGSIFSVGSKFFFPGLLKNQSFMMSLSYQKQHYKKILYSNRIVFPRGYIDDLSSENKSFSADYLFPLLYPDFSIGSLAYIKRFAINLFYDLSQNTRPYKENNLIVELNKNMHSFGFETYIDFHLFRTRFPLRFKFQQGWKGRELSSFTSFGLVLDVYGSFGFSKNLYDSIFTKD